MSLYQTKFWRDSRKRILNRDPLCQNCLKEGRLTKANEIDHIIPFKTELEFYSCKDSNLQGLCKSCHSQKTRLENTPSFEDKKKELLKPIYL